MVPVSLRLKNFLSYGSQAKELDFSHFHVACLSGANGQGKSALLDAITWAIWGKTERGRGHAHLVRTGSEKDVMRVELVFAIEEARYRIVRIYENSVHRVELHQAGEASNSGYRPLSGTGVKETQSNIERLVGLDYPTFINSAYLLQGRSNEFTRGSPGERKQVLGKILNLQRYEVLREQAILKKSSAAATAERTAAQIEQLTVQIDEAPQLRSRHKELTQSAAEQSQALERIGEEVQALVGELASLESKEKLVTTLAADIVHLTEQIDQFSLEKKRVQDQLNETEALIGQSEAIQGRFEDKTAIEKELQAQEDKRAKHQSLVRQRDKLDRELTRLKTEFDKKLSQQTSKKALLELQISELEEAETKRRPAIVTRLDRARQAQTAAAKLRKKKSEVDKMDAEIAACRLDLEQERLALDAQLKTLEASLTQVNQELQTIKTLQARREALMDSLHKRADLEAHMQAVEEKGIAISSLTNTLNGKIEAWLSNLAERKEQIAYMVNPGAASCPTCGTELTETHRASVAQELQIAAEELQQNIENGRRQSDQHSRKLKELRAQYKSQAEQLKQIDRDQQALAALEEVLNAALLKQEQAQQMSHQIDGIRTQLSEESYKEAVKMRLAGLEKRRQKTEFNATEYDQAVARAGAIGPLEDELSGIDSKLARKPALESDLNGCLQEIKQWERELTGGAQIASLVEKDGQVKAQIESLGFDSVHLDRLRQKLSTLSSAGQDLIRLQEGIKAKPEYVRRLERLEQDIQHAASNRTSKQADQQSHSKALAGKPAVEEALLSGRRKQHELQSKWGELQGRIGKVEEQQKQIMRNREERKSARNKLRRAKDDVVIYGHLQKAFSRRGIPSLIIEQSIHEIEQRANQLLGRLTDGRMRIQIQMLTEKLTGGTRETLEIRVSDELGAYRPYETYSGGEAFRINFALRIALSQLLAARSGVPIRTLVIDEGFGTQDEHGIQCIVDAITEVRKDFEKILIITHLDAVKDAFAVRIEVAKDPVTGSSFNLIGV